MKNKYEVKFLVKGIVSVTVTAETQEEAVKIGKEKMNHISTFSNKLDYIDGTEEFIGVDNISKWDEAQS